MLLTALARIFAALNANRRESEIAGAICLGTALALIPAANLIWFALFLLAFLVKVNLGFALLTLGVVTPLALLFDSTLDSLGFAVLSQEALYDGLTALYNAPLGPVLGIHNTSVVGGAIVSVLLFAPLFFGTKALVRLYRDTLRAKIADLRIVRWWQRLPLAATLRRVAGQARSMYEMAGF